MGDIVVKIDKGKSREVATNILKKYKSNVMNVSTRINSERTLAAQILCNDLSKLFFYFIILLGISCIRNCDVSHRL
jgi:hypothetical protein